MSTKSKESIVKNVAMVIPVFISFVALAVQWGAITTKLSVYEKSLSDVLKVMEKQNDKIDKIQEQVSFIKGKMEGKHGDK